LQKYQRTAIGDSAIGRFPGFGAPFIINVGGYPKAKALRRFDSLRSTRCY